MSVDGKVTGSVGIGLCVLVGIGHEDTEEDARWMADKVVDLRILLNYLHTEGIEAQASAIGDILSSCLKRPDLQDERRGVDGKEKNPKLVWTVDVEFLCQAFSI